MDHTRPPEPEPTVIDLRASPLGSVLRPREEQMTEAGGPVLAALRRTWSRIATAAASVPWAEIVRLLAEYQHLMPTNLRGRPALVVAMRDPESSGVPIAWVVPPDLAIALVYDCADEPAQVALLMEEQERILSYCRGALAQLDFVAAAETRASIEALVDGHFGPAQSHAANIIDSVLLGVGAPLKPAEARRQVLARAELTSDPTEPARAYVDSIVLRPLANAYIRWFPGGDEPAPPRFARHVTAHGAHIEDVFRSEHALVAVLLACSLCIHYRNELTAPGTPPISAIAVTPEASGAWGRNPQEERASGASASS